MITREDRQPFHDTCRILDKADDFIYVLPHPGLLEWISNYTITFPNGKIISDDYTVMPHGSATLVFTFDGNNLCSNLFGPITKPCMIGRQANQNDMLFIIEFQPAGLHAFTGVDQRELSDQTLPFSFINPVLNKKIMETLDSVHSMHELVIHIDHILLSCLPLTHPGELHLSVESIIKNSGNISVKELSEAVYYSERQLNRIFSRYLGMNTKTFSRLVRINKAVRLLQNPGTSISSVCYSAGFYDLSHFIHDFKDVTGITPLDYRHKMSDFYSEIAKF